MFIGLCAAAFLPEFVVGYMHDFVNKSCIVNYSVRFGGGLVLLDSHLPRGRGKTNPIVIALPISMIVMIILQCQYGRWQPPSSEVS